MLLSDGREFAAKVGFEDTVAGATDSGASGGIDSQTDAHLQLPDTALDEEELSAVTACRAASADADNLQREIRTSESEGELPLFMQSAKEIDVLLGQLDTFVATYCKETQRQELKRLQKSIQKSQRKLRVASSRADRWRKRVTQNLLETNRKTAKCVGELLIQVYTAKNRNLRQTTKTAASNLNANNNKKNISYRNKATLEHVGPLVALMASPYSIPLL